MKRMITILLSLIPLISWAQEPITTNGYMLDGDGSMETLDAAVLTESKSKDKVLDGKGMRFPGGVVCFEPDIQSAELGSIVQTKNSFLVRSIDLTIQENHIAGCQADIKIYKIGEEDVLTNIVTMTIVEDIPTSDHKTEIRFAPEDRIVLEPGRYYISFMITHESVQSKSPSIDSETGHFAKMYFPLYLKSSYKRSSSDSPLEKCGYNIGLTVRGSRL